MLKNFIFNKKERIERDNIHAYEENGGNEVLPNTANRTMFQRFGEVIFICIFSFSLFILLSLLSYKKTDPNWFGLASFDTTVLNSGGWMGAYLADTLFFLFGWLAYAVPFVMVYLVWFQLYPARFNETEKEMMSHRWQLIGAFLLFFGATGLSCLFFYHTSSFFPYSAGGALGDILLKTLSVAIRTEGALLLLLTFFLVGVTLLTGFSWMLVVEKVGFCTLWIINTILSRVSQIFNRTSSDISSDAFANQDRERGPRIDRKTASILSASVERTPVGIAAVNLNKVSENSSLAARIFNVNEDIEEMEMDDGNEDFSPALTQPSNFSTRAKDAFSLGAQQSIKNERGVFRSSSQEHKTSVNSAWALPSLSLLEPVQKTLDKGYSSAQLESMAREVEQRLLDFGIEVQVVAVHPGPVITRFELQLAPGVKVSRISGLAKDLARSLSVMSVRVVDVIPGKPVIGLELPNQHREMVRLSEVFLTDQFQQTRSPISLAMGVDIAGYPVIVDLAKMPHMLVAGTTGSGKSVGLNAMLLSILFKATPEMVRLILVDPKMLEFSIYDGIPHLLTPVVTDMKEAAGALRWSVAEMERRYRLMSALGVRNLAAYNTMVKEGEQKGELIQDPLWKPTQDMQSSPPFLETLPYIVVVIDELADMMMVVGKKVEQLIARIAQKARAAGIHLILATQRPSVDVLTGLIKSNIPTRISFQVSSKIDSRTILDQQGAEQLLGHGDMLYLTPGSGTPVRIHGAFVDDKEVHRVTDALRAQAQPEYVDIIGKSAAEGGSEGDLWGDGGSESVEEADPLYDEAVQFVTETRKASISSLQRRLKVGYNRAARLIEEMERTGIVSGMESGGVRDVLVPAREEA